MLTIDTIPLYQFWIWEFGFGISKSAIRNPQSNLLVFPVQCVAAAATAELFELKPVGRGLFVLGRHVIALLTISALQNNIVSSAFRHFYLLCSECEL